MGNQLETIFNIIAKDLASKTIDKIGKKFKTLPALVRTHDKVQKVAEKTLDKYKNQLVKTASGAGKVKEKIQKLSKTAQTQNKLTKSMGLTQKTFNGLMGESGLGIRKNGEVFDESTNKILNQGQAVTKLTKTQKDMNAMFGKSWTKDQQKRVVDYARKEKHLGMTASTLGSVLNKNGMYIDKSNKLASVSKGKIKNQDMAQHQLVNSTKRFRMELLSVMFFGMAVQRFFGALTKGSLEASGAMGVWSAITMLMGLPIAMKLTEALIKLLEWWGNLDEGTQKTISTILWAGLALGTFLMIVGTVGLGIGGLTKYFGVLFPAAAAKFTIAITAAGGGLKGFFAVLGKSVFGKLIGILAVVLVLYTGIKNMTEGWGKSALKVGKGILYVLIAIGGIIAIIAGAPIWIVAGIVLLAAWLVKVLAKVEPIKNAFIWLGRAVMGFSKGLKSLFSGKGFKAGWAEGFAVPGEEAKETKLAAGGIVRRPTRALIGEAGPEAVIPLNNGFSRENNIYYNPTIHINASISNDMDIENVAKKVNELLYSELRGVSIR